MIEWLNQLWNSFAQDLIEVLPYSPFRQFIESWSVDIPSAISWLNWLMPISEAIEILEAWLICYGIYLLASIVMRWIKAIE